MTENPPKPKDVPDEVALLARIRVAAPRYRVELLWQAQAAGLAWNRILHYLHPRALVGTELVYWSIHVFLTHAANISLLLWPLDGAVRNKRKGLEQVTGRRYRELRGAFLRSELSVQDDSPLRARTLRDHVAHFDERIDRLAGPTVSDMNIGPREGIPGPVIRHFDPEIMTYYFGQDVFELFPTAKEVERIDDALEAMGVIFGRTAPLDDRVWRVLTLCQKTQQVVATGMAMSVTDFNAIEIGGNSFRCPCGEVHAIVRTMVWLEW